jgi:hypothetical protein
VFLEATKAVDDPDRIRKRAEKFGIAPKIDLVRRRPLKLLPELTRDLRSDFFPL